MKVQFNPYQNFNTTKPNNASLMRYQYNLGQDTVSFGAIKKSKLNNYQLLCANYFKAPLDKFKSTEDFQNWSLNELEQTLNLDQYYCASEFDPREVDEPNTNERMGRLNIWKDYLLDDKEMKTHPELALMIANSITRELYPETKNFPPLFDKDTVKTTINEINEIASANPKATVNFKNKYQENLKTDILKTAEIIEDKTSKGNGYWVRVPSESNDKENFKKNLKTLNVLSCEAWCTKGHFAQKYLKDGDFYIYMENNSPELSVRLEDSTIKEVRDRNHSAKIHLGYFDSLNSLIQEKGLDGYDSDIQSLENRKALVNFAKSLIQDDIDNKNYANVLKLAGIKSTVMEDGLLELSNFKKPHNDYTFQDLGIDENEMFKHIGAIKGNADFSDTEVTNLGNLKSIDGYVFLKMSKLNDLGNVQLKQRVFRD